MSSWLLNPASWDLMIDANNDLAVAANPYALAQNVACALKTFAGEVYYDTSLGVQYQELILGELPPTSLLYGQFIDAALTVDGVFEPIKVFITGFDNRVLTGAVLFTDATGNALSVSF